MIILTYLVFLFIFVWYFRLGSIAFVEVRGCHSRSWNESRSLSKIHYELSNCVNHSFRLVSWRICFSASFSINQRIFLSTVWIKIHLMMLFLLFHMLIDFMSFPREKSKRASWQETNRSNAPHCIWRVDKQKGSRNSSSNKQWKHFM